MSKRFFYLFTFFIVPSFLFGCSKPSMIGESSPRISMQVDEGHGVSVHEKVIAQYGLYQDQELQSYIDLIGGKLVQGRARGDVSYRFYVLDTPMVNAFALPSGYIYLTRGVLSLVNSEAEIAAVLAHEIAHVEAGHSAAFHKIGSYSRAQENQADELGMQYLHRAGYDVKGMVNFLSFMMAQKDLDTQIFGRGRRSRDSFITHPPTQERLENVVAMMSGYAAGGVIGREDYLRHVEGMMYGGSPLQGMVRGHVFVNPSLGVWFEVPEQFRMENMSDKVVARAQSGATIIFDMVRASGKPEKTLDGVLSAWSGQEPIDVRYIDVNGFDAAMTRVSGAVDGAAMNILLVVIQFDAAKIARFMIAYPDDVSTEERKKIERSFYSFGKVSVIDERGMQPYRLAVVTAKQGDSVQSMEERMVLKDGYSAPRFRVLNGLREGDDVVVGQSYKMIDY